MQWHGKNFFNGRLRRLCVLLGRCWVWMCLRLLLLVGPWRYCWACEDLDVLRPYYPEMDVQFDGLLPLPICLNKLPTRVPYVVVPLFHLVLWLTDLLMVPLYLEKKPGSAGPFRVLRPLLTSSRSVLDEILLLQPWQAATVMARSHADSIIQRTKAPAAVKYLLIAHYLLLCGFYFFASVWVGAFVLVNLVLFSGMLRFLLFGLLFFGFFVAAGAFPVAMVKAVSHCAAKRREPPSSMTEIRAYHGTTIENAESIRKQGFLASSTGMLGRGVYVSRDINKVLAYAGHNGVILELRVVLGRVCVVDHQGHEYQRLWHGSYDTAWVPSKCGMVGSGVEEGCIANPECVKLVRVWQKHPSHLMVLMVYELLRLALDAFMYCGHLCKIPRGGESQPELNQPMPRPDLELMMPRMAPPRHTTCLDMERFKSFTHTTVPPPLFHKIKRG
ncbi:hypothetical protein AK812_SmicGene5138 [Symbiodinium microadriaticum]|uniref:Uncharacterized protein n=1 Tax=Symbiodinium microadriaticum TaxID=2951 RepID=A0A1Q9EUF7_SYMMI|nr:hypothetical protein AK812_SmicGene5138 [Symbiodinium microadriaticum]